MDYDSTVGNVSSVRSKNLTVEILKIVEIEMKMKDGKDGKCGNGGGVKRMAMEMVEMPLGLEF